MPKSGLNLKQKSNSQILRYWHAVELFTPQSLPKVNPKELITDYEVGQVLPWEAAHPLQQILLPQDRAWRFQLYAGVLPTSKLREVLEDKFGADPNTFDERNDGETCLFALTVNQDGQPLWDSFTLSSCLWALGRTLAVGPQDAKWLNGFSEAGEAHKTKLAETYALANEIKRDDEESAITRFLTSAQLFQELDKLIEAIGVTSLYQNRIIRIKAVQVSLRNADQADEQDFLNSFYLNDLNEIGGKHHYGQALKDYLTPYSDELGAQRIDLRKKMTVLFKQLAPSRFPAGRWPSKDHHPLVFSQQLAVNTIWQRLADKSGIFGINGPPGTGKTTLLRDLVAAIVVQRASLLADLKKPKDAFPEKAVWKTGKYNRTVHYWASQFRGLGIVVASNNNGAVENVTLEIPGAQAVDPNWDLDYHSDLASALIGQPAWGMIAAKLGNKSNREEFRTQFWFGNAKGQQTPSFQDRLKQRSLQLVNWSKAVASFRNAQAAEAAARQKCQKLYAQYLAALKAEDKPQARKELKQARQVFGTAAPTPEHWDKEIEARELSSPWATKEWVAARANLFKAALALQDQFITANAKIYQANLQSMMDVLAGTVPAGMDIQGIVACWETLFSVIPVISTTFASFDRLFSHLGKEQLGWLLIDEAGQATPQSAVGAIWRAKRVVVVGDPLQLEPVVTVPLSAQEALRKHFNVDEEWLPGRRSVQELADQATPYGTELPGPNGMIWVGAPLRVHRRCDEPMFSISNQIAYDGLMVSGVKRPEIELPASGWFDVISQEAEGHWLPAEGQALQQLIEKLLSNPTVQPKDIFLVSPFRDVAIKLYRYARQNYAEMPAGTVHTAQGKEADIVILVLGGDPNKPGAKQWATSRPNLLNVAVSRARRRLYVIGNRRLWAQQNYFNTLSDALSNYFEI